MTVTIPPEFVPFVEQLVASGEFQSQESVIGEALELLREERQQFQELQAEIAIGIDQANRGEVVPFDADKIIASARKQFAKAE